VDSLKPAEVDALVASYQAGKTMKELANDFGINRNTVSAHLHRADIALRQLGLGPAQTAQLIDLYRAGWSSGRLAQRFEVSADTVLKALRRAGIAIRPRRRGGPQPTALTPEGMRRS
jgi:DNA-directed RNA polymerase specialized sigma24 family protein